MGTENGSGQASSSPSRKPSGGQSSVIASDAALERFAKSFESSARRWELIVYPSLFAFIILAAYGFFLIYSLTQDMHTLAVRMDPNMGENMETMADRISVLSVNIESMSKRIEEMRVDIGSMTEQVTEMTSYVSRMEKQMVAMTADTGEMSTKLNALDPMLGNMAAMSRAMQSMTASTGQMSWDMYQIKRPMNMMNQFMPW
jgi:TolA-binding protein